MNRLASWMSSRRSHGTIRKPRGRGLRVESLEDRLQPSTLSVDAGGLLTYTAGAGVANHLTISLDPATDTYTFRDAEVINAPGFLGNGTTAISVPNGAVSAMKVLLGDVADALTVEATADRIQVQAGTGDDQIILVSPGGTLDGIRGRVSVAGEDGIDALAVNDQGAAAGKGYTLTASSLTRAGFLLVDSYGTLEGVNLYTTGLNDAVVVRSTAAGTAVAVNAGFGDDTLTVANASGGLDGIQGQLFVYGQEGAKDTIVVDDTGSSAGRFFDYATTFVQRSGSAIIYYGAESVVVKAGAFDDTFSVRGTSTSTTLNTGDGNDLIRVDFFDHIQAPLTVNGQAGSGDVLTTGENFTTLGQTYTITSVSVSRTGFPAPIKYGTLESVVVSGTAHDDRFNVLSTAAGTAVTLHAGDGNDATTVGSNAGNPGSSTLDLIQGALTVDAGAGNGGLTLNDQANRSGQTFTVTSGSVSRSGAAPINYSFQDRLEVNAGGFSDVVNVRTTAAGTSVSVNLGKGDDTANVGDPRIFTGTTLGGIQGGLTVDCQGGTDVVNLNDQQVGIFNPPNPTGQSYIARESSLSRSGAAYIIYYAAEDVTLNASCFNDTITVTLESSPPLTVNAGEGADTILMAENLSEVLVLNRPVTVNGQGGIDTLVYSYIDLLDDIIDVRVNLALGTATGLAGLGGVENVTGGSGDDILIGDAADNILRGGAGGDLLIGREGADQLFGDNGEDILIGNATVYDADPAALGAIMSEWRRTDRSYGQRVQNLKLGVGNNGAVRLDLTKLVEDGARDILTGGGDALDWFFLTGEDLAPDLNQPALEQVN